MKKASFGNHYELEDQRFRILLYTYMSPSKKGTDLHLYASLWYFK